MTPAAAVLVAFCPSVSWELDRTVDPVIRGTAVLPVATLLKGSVPTPALGWPGIPYRHDVRLVARYEDGRDDEIRWSE